MNLITVSDHRCKLKKQWIGGPTIILLKRFVVLSGKLGRKNLKGSEEYWMFLCGIVTHTKRFEKW